jgi:hypothetical protein
MHTAGAAKSQQGVLAGVVTLRGGYLPHSFRHFLVGYV